MLLFYILKLLRYHKLSSTVHIYSLNSLQDYLQYTLMNFFFKSAQSIIIFLNIN